MSENETIDHLAERHPARVAPQRSVAIVAWQALPAVFPNLGRGIGGMETAAWTFAKGLTGIGQWSAAIIVRADVKLPADTVDGVRLHASVERWESVRRDVAQCIDLHPFRWKRFRPSLLWKLPALLLTRPFRSRDPELMRPDPRLTSFSTDVWVAMGVGKESAGVIATAHSQNRPCVLMIRCGADLDERYIADEISFSDYGERSDVCRFAIEQADVIVCQSNIQVEKLKRVFGRDGHLIRNPIDLNVWQRPANDRLRRGVIWVGRYDDFHKRIPLAIEIARRCPEIPFTFIANRGDADIESSTRAACPPNVTLIDYVRANEMHQRFASALAFLSTSDHRVEGFPNVLLQAAASGTPIVSLNDFDGFLEASAAGFPCESSLEHATQTLADVVAGKLTIDHEAVDAYLQTYHSTPAVITKLSGLLSTLLAARVTNGS
ncbi:glycosyltransferase family 4 protein [Stieleria varia]|uniref:glycosyltransferase family 4 protein n=1 Tax=Stieleria varia TaxID=2528005 RepID=UPI0018D240D1|nr:glycosyltransferase family 4 protein [Stieleria varia]